MLSLSLIFILRAEGGGVASSSLSSQLRFLFAGFAGSDMGTSDGRAILRSAGLGTRISKENLRLCLVVRKGSGCWWVVGRVGDCERTSLSIFSSGVVSFSTIESKGALNFSGQ